MMIAHQRRMVTDQRRMMTDQRCRMAHVCGRMISGRRMIGVRNQRRMMAHRAHVIRRMTQHRRMANQRCMVHNRRRMMNDWRRCRHVRVRDQRRRMAVAETVQAAFRFGRCVGWSGVRNRNVGRCFDSVRSRCSDAERRGRGQDDGYAYLCVCGREWRTGWSKFTRRKARDTKRARLTHKALHVVDMFLRMHVWPVDSLRLNYVRITANACLYIRTADACALEDTNAEAADKCACDISA